jgi:hypothetical protein
MMVFDEWQNGVPIEFIVMGKNQESDFHLVFLSLSQIMPNDWMSPIIIVDNVQVEINFLR